MSRSQTTIYVSGLSLSTTEDVLYSAFEPFGEIVEIHLPKNQQRNRTNPDPSSLQQPQQQQQSNSNQHRGFGFIVFTSSDDVEGAIDNMNLNEIDGQVITVTLAKPIKSANSFSSAGFDSRKPVWEDEEWIKQYGGGGGGGEEQGDQGVNNSSTQISEATNV